MKKSILFLLIAFWLPSQLIAQSLSSSVVSCMGQHYASAQTQMSVTAGETVVEYYSSSIYSLGAGFQQSFEAFVKQLMVTLFLEGPFVVNAMLTTLNSSGLIPLAQPYNTAPWNHSGTEEAAYIPPNVVDWVLIELRDADSPGNATPATTLTGWPKAFFLKNDGSLVDLDGNMPNLGNLVFNDDLYVVVRHRNHLDVMSSGPLSLSGSTYTYDFTDAITKAHGGAAGYKQIGAGLYGMVAGDIDADGSITVLDFSDWASAFGITGTYNKADADMDGQVSVLDFSKWAANFGIVNPLTGISQLKYASMVPETE